MDFESINSEMLKPHSLLSVDRGRIHSVQQELQTYDRLRGEDRLKSYYSNKLSSYTRMVVELYYYAKEDPRRYTLIYSSI